MSKFLPSRPDEAPDLNSKPQVGGSNAAGGSMVARPDLIMGTTSSAGGPRSVSVDRASAGIAARRNSNGPNSGGTGAPNKVNPIVAARKSTAGQSTSALPSTVQPSSTSSAASGTSNAQDLSSSGIASPGARAMFNKMSSFFTGTHK